MRLRAQNGWTEPSTLTSGAPSKLHKSLHPRIFWTKSTERGVAWMENRRLSALAPGESGVVRELLLPPASCTRLEELGFWPGTRVACRCRAPSGSPAAYVAAGAVFALRTCDAAQIVLEDAP